MALTESVIRNGQSYVLDKASTARKLVEVSSELLKYLSQDHDFQIFTSETEIGRQLFSDFSELNSSIVSIRGSITSLRYLEQDFLQRQESINKNK